MKRPVLVCIVTFLLCVSITIVSIVADESSVGECREYDDKTGQCKSSEEAQKTHHQDQKKKTSTCVTVAVTPNSTGLFHDAAVLKMYVGSDVSLFTMPTTARTSECQVRIFLEQTPSYLVSSSSGSPPNLHKDWISEPSSSGERNWVMINPDQFYDELLYQPNLELVLCKTHLCVDFIKKARTRLKVQVPILYMGFTSIVDNVKGDSSGDSGSDSDGPQKEAFNSFLHIAGQSPFKGTVAVIQAWIHNPHWPKLTVTSFNNHLLNLVLGKFYQDGMKLPPNLEHVDRKLRPSEIAHLRTNHSIHLCTSSMEGFGHYLNEARAVGALVVSTDYPSMNEFFEEDPTSGILVKPSKLETWKDYMVAALVDAEGIQSAVTQILSMTMEDRAAMGVRAKQAYEKDRHTFAKMAKKLQCLASRHTCHRDDNVETCAATCGISHLD